MVHVFLIDVEHLLDPIEAPELLLGLPKDRIEKINRIKRPLERRQSLGAGLLLEYGKKQFGEEYEYNLSHSGTKVILAASCERVGCDIEKTRDISLKVAKRYFCEREAAYLENLDEAEFKEEFFRLWTIKESFTKMHKRGISMGLSSFEVMMGNDIKILREGQIEDCFVKEYEQDGYKIAVCSTENEFENNLRIINI